MSPAESPDPGANPYRPPAALPPDPPRRIEASEGAEEVIQTIIPTRNAPALIGYYLGLFSCLPVLGLPLAVAGVVLGWKGLQKVRREPAAHGTLHAWIGLVCGSIGLVINLLIVAAIVAALVADSMGK